MSETAQFDYFQHCVHCGLCLPTCPTYAELGDENDSPRGRIYLMQAIDSGRIAPSERIQHHLDLCLDCRACETVCPSGVQYGRLIESYRTKINGDHHRRTGVLDWWVRRMVLYVFPYRHRIKWLRRVLRMASAMGVFEFLRASGFAERYGAGLRFAEVLDREPSTLTPLPRHSLPQRGKPRARIGLFIGCVGEAILGATNRATHRVLRRNGCAVDCPTEQVCCGAIHYHAGDRASAARFARANIEAFESPNEPLDAIVVNVAGCGLMLKDYAELLSDDPQYAERARHFAGRVRDVSEFLTEHGIEPPTHAIAERVTYHHACHLCHGQGIRQQPQHLLKLIPGLELVDLKEAEWCCGAAGSYSLTQPEMANRLARRKLQNIDETHSQIVATANAGCILHLRQQAIETGRDVHIVHPIDLLDRAYGPSDERC